MADQGNAVTARWVGPAGFQLFDGARLDPGSIVEGIGYDEAKDSPYWEIVTKPNKNDVPVSDVAPLREDWSFGVEEGGGATGRPETAEQSQASASTTDPVQQAPDPKALEGEGK